MNQIKLSLKLWPVIKLRCPYCGKSPLLKEKSWFTFREGCSECRYVYEREEGYFTGAAWMVNYLVVSVAGIIAGAFLLYNYPDMNTYILAGIPAAVATVVAVAFMPYGKALWLYFDHRMHPLDAEEHVEYDATH